MPAMLYIDACARGEKSRTRALAEAFLSALPPQWTVTRRYLYVDIPAFVGADETETRKDIRDAISLAAADAVTIAAPYWDLSYPAILKAYFERASACGVTFRYTERGSEGLCRGERAVYVSTSGGMIEGAHLGEDYARALLGMLGYKRLCALRCEGLDIDGTDADAILAKAAETAREKGKTF